MLLMAVPARAQLDLGSQDIPQDRIDGYMDPFYHVIAAGLGAGRFLPLDDRLGFDAGLHAEWVPLPDKDPFKSVNLSGLPMFRAQGGLRFGGADVMGRGMVWHDPRIGNTSTAGAGIQYGKDLFGNAWPLAAALMGGWDFLDFSSTYTYRYRGSTLGLFDQDIPGDYSLVENVFAGGAMASSRHGPWKFYAQSWFEWTSGKFDYLFVDPRDGKNKDVRSNLGFPGARILAGAAWHGFHAEAGWRSYFIFGAGWSWIQ